MKDVDFLFSVLADECWHGWPEIMRRSQQERGCGLTIHSRAAELRRRGHTIECRSERKSGRTVSFYRLVPLDPSTLPSSADLTPALPSSRGVDGSSGPGLAVTAGGAARDADPVPLVLVPGQLVLEGVAA